MASSLWKCLSLLVVLLFFIASVAAKPKVLKMELNKRVEAIHADMEERASASGKQYSNIVIGNSVTATKLYFVNASVGTPPQMVQLQVDTGSSDVWMFGIHSCDPATSLCLGGDFDPSASSSFSSADKGGFSIKYDTPNSIVKGDYFNDTFSIGSITLRNLTMAVADEVESVATGIMGIGFDAGESIVSQQGGQPYHNIMDAMVAQGIIQTRAYSLWLNDLAAPDGSILFGGYDKAKFKGDLTAVPMQPDSQSGQVTTMTVAWTSFSVTDPQSGTTTFTSNNFAEPAILDSGTSLTYLPTDLFNQVANIFDVIDDPEFSPGLVDCEAFDEYKGTIDFGFGGPGGPVISVPLSQLALPLLNSKGKPMHFSNGKPACQFGLGPLTEDMPILFGDTFLRSAYVVYDLDNKQIAIAPTVVNTTESNIVEIGQGDAAPTWNVANAVAATQTATGYQQVPGVLSAPTAQITAADASATGFRLPGSSTAAAKSAAPSSPNILPAGTIRSILFSILSSLLGAAFIAFHS
ncbi:Aspartic peptidase domain containing protein [Elaphomyces granulatus]